MEKRSSILKEKRRKKSIHLIKTTSNTLESKVSNMTLLSQKEIEMNKGDSDTSTQTPRVPNLNSSKKYFNDKEQPTLNISEPLQAPPALLSITSGLHSTLEKHVQQKVDTSLKTKSLRW